MKQSILFVIIFSASVLLVHASEPTRFRGAMISPHHFHESDLQVLGESWNANVVRWQLNWSFPHGEADKASVEDSYSWLESECKLLDTMLPFLRASGVKVCLDMHTSPGGFNQNDVNRIFEEKEFAEAFLEAWRRLATHYNDENVIWAYDILNEPVERDRENGEYHISWHDLAERTVSAIREIDAKTPIVYEPASWAGPYCFQNLVPLNCTNIIYSVHMYLPLEFTHQGIPEAVKEDIPYSYPGLINGDYWDKEKLRETLEPVLNFQRKYNVPVLVGEFSAIRWAPKNSAYNYLKDVIDIFEEYGWDWIYHAFREWEGWSLEYPEDKTADAPAVGPTPRQLLLRAYFEKNICVID